MIVRLARGASLLIVALLFALPTLAADDHGDAHHAEASPSLFSVDPGLMIWTIVTFVLVLIVLSQTAWKPIIAGLKEREKNIEGAIAEAKKVKSEAEELYAKYQTMLDQAKDESRAILEEARKDGAQVKEEIRAAAQQEAEEFKNRARKEIDLAKNSALQEIWEEAAGLSTELATRILGRSMNESDQERLVRELIEEMKGEMAGRQGTGAA